MSRAFAPVKAAGMDIGLYVLRFGGGKRLERREACVQHRRDLVDTLICALRGQPHGKQQFIIFLILQGAVRRVGLCQTAEDLLHLFRCAHIVHLSGSVAHFCAACQVRRVAKARKMRYNIAIALQEAHYVQTIGG